MMKATKGCWVEIETEVLKASERASTIPEDTKKTPLLMWARGFLVDEKAVTGEDVSIKTLCDRTLTGKLVEVNPRYEHDYGETVMELLETGVNLKRDLGGVE